MSVAFYELYTKRMAVIDATSVGALHDCWEAVSGVPDFDTLAALDPRALGVLANWIVFEGLALDAASTRHTRAMVERPLHNIIELTEVPEEVFASAQRTSVAFEERAHRAAEEVDQFERNETRSQIDREVRGLGINVYFSPDDPSRPDYDPEGRTILYLELADRARVPV